MWRLLIMWSLFNPTRSLLNQQELVYERLVARNERTFGFFPFIIPPYKIGSVTPSRCVAPNNFEGTCMTRTKCANISGRALDTCGTNKRGVCCVNVQSCNSTNNVRTTTAPVSYFTNPGFSSTFSGAIQCQLVVNQWNSNVCQLRIDFMNLVLAPPSIEETTYGRCITDSLVLGSSGLPAICGSNTGQHVYVPFNPNAAFHRITIDTSDTNNMGSFERMWNLKVTQIQCNDTARAPSGCLMYYNDISGTVSSFNYDDGPPATTVTTWTRQITGLHYGICVKPAQDICDIQWTVNDNDFSLSTEDTAQTQTCSASYILIPRSPQADAETRTDRICGSTFPADGVLTDTMPFVLYVITDFSENINLVDQTRGFKLSYRQIPCDVF